MKMKSFSALLTVLVMSSVSGADKKDLGISKGNLAPCPTSPNCVSTQSEHNRHAMAPLPYWQTGEKSRECILGILKGMKRVRIVESTESYVHAEFKTALWGFVDDVEFLFDEASRIVHFRSASRSGYYDFGLNRRRMKEISGRYLRALGK
jgi:uncharacterized protein (DUF1499 family)